MSFAPEILADVPFGLSNNISIQVYTQGYGSGIKMKFAILKSGHVRFSEFVKIIAGNGTEISASSPGCVSFAPEILADVPFGLSNNISILSL